MTIATRLPSFPRLTWLTPFSLLAGCTGIPDGARAISDFKLDPYLGRWYEIARLPHGFEEDLSCVTATYSRRADGGIDVANRGYHLKENRWEIAEGKAYFIEEPNVGRLKIGFFGSYYGGYNILELDDGYRHALVAGPDRDHLWVLAREPEIDEATYRSLVRRARELDFPIQRLTRVEQRPLIYPERRQAS